jgi:hypothetical protein
MKTKPVKTELRYLRLYEAVNGGLKISKIKEKTRGRRLRESFPETGKEVEREKHCYEIQRRVVW